MNPRLVLSLWRERWGKANDAASGIPYLRGKLNQWGDELTHGSAWTFPGVIALALVGCVLIYMLLMTARFSLGGQAAFSILYVSAALYLRRYAGTLVTLVLYGMFIVVSTRYIYWRLTATLGSELNLDFVLGFTLWVAELFAWLLITLRITQNIWPLTRAPEPLPKDTVTWPTVDVFILAQGQVDSSIRSATLAALELDWPKSKIKAYILDATHQESLQEIADALGAGYLVSCDPCGDGESGLINGALPETKGELILILDGVQMPDRSFLHSIVGWFLRDKRLGMLQTPHHFLTPTPSTHGQTLCRAPSFPGGVAWAVLRRTMLAAVGGVESQPNTGHVHAALQLQARGYGHGYIGHTLDGAAPDADAPAKPSSSAREAQFAPSLFRVDGPFLGRTLRLKLHLESLRAMLQFYYPVQRFIFFTAPLAYLLGGIAILQTTPEFLGAYALAYMILAYFAQSRLQGAKRLPAWTDFRETALAWYLLIPTTFTLVRTELRRCLRLIKVDTQSSFESMITWPSGLIALLNLAGLGVGLARLPSLSDGSREMTIFYILWCTYNLMLLASRLAVAEETRHLRQQTRRFMQMPAMVRIFSGRTIACVTQNFPQTELILKLPVPLAVEKGASIHLSIFKGPHEFTYPAHVTSQNDSMLLVRIDAGSQIDYRMLGAAVFSRGPNWPQWLPGRHADHPLPPWVSRLFVAAFTKVIEAAWMIDKFVKWQRLGNWIGKWKKKT